MPKNEDSGKIVNVSKTVPAIILLLTRIFEFAVDSSNGFGAAAACSQIAGDEMKNRLRYSLVYLDFDCHLLSLVESESMDLQKMCA